MIYIFLNVLGMHPEACQDACQNINLKAEDGCLDFKIKDSFI